MKILWLSPSDMVTEPVIEGLTGHDTSIYRYDQWGVPVDRGILDAVDRAKPDVILYIGQNSGRFVPSMGTLLRLRDHAASVLICFDGSDTTWVEPLNRYQEHGAFHLIVNIDGNPDWPRREHDLTLLTPTATRFYGRPSPLASRPVNFGFAGGLGSPSRRAIVEPLRESVGLIVPQRNEAYGTYDIYAAFMKACKIVLNVPLSGSDNANQVKGRVVEAGWAGCCLLEHEASGARNWFIPEVDYPVYHNAEDAATRVKMLRTDPDAMQYFADNLAHRVRAEHHPDIFWSKVFGRLGL